MTELMHKLRLSWIVVMVNYNTRM